MNRNHDDPCVERLFPLAGLLIVGAGLSHVMRVVLSGFDLEAMLWFFAPMRILCGFSPVGFVFGLTVLAVLMVTAICFLEAYATGTHPAFAIPTFALGLLFIVYAAGGLRFERFMVDVAKKDLARYGEATDLIGYDAVGLRSALSALGEDQLDGQK